MTTAATPAERRVLFFGESRERSEATRDGLERLGWRLQRPTPASSENAPDAATGPPVAALVVGGGNGAQLIEQIHREQPTLPIVVLTDDADEAEQALGQGATATLPVLAPTSLVHAQLRAAVRETPASNAATSVLHVRDLSIDLLRHEIRSGNTVLDLTPAQYRILALLARFAGKTLEAEFLHQHAEGRALGPDTAREIIRFQIARLRQKIKAATGRSDYIINVRKSGYLLETHETIGGPV